jgi:hypothetical protein
MELKTLIRENLHPLAMQCGYDKYVVLSGKKYSVGKMSYDEYFLEPFRKGRTERDNFDKNTLWEKSDGIEILQLLIDNKIIKLTNK